MPNSSLPPLSLSIPPSNSSWSLSPTPSRARFPTAVLSSLIRHHKNQSHSPSRVQHPSTTAPSTPNPRAGEDLSNFVWDHPPLRDRQRSHSRPRPPAHRAVWEEESSLVEMAKLYSPLLQRSTRHTPPITYADSLPANNLHHPPASAPLPPATLPLRPSAPTPIRSRLRSRPSQPSGLQSAPIPKVLSTSNSRSNSRDQHETHQRAQCSCSSVGSSLCPRSDSEASSASCYSSKFIHTQNPNSHSGDSNGWPAPATPSDLIAHTRARAWSSPAPPGPDISLPLPPEPKPNPSYKPIKSTALRSADSSTGSGGSASCETKPACFLPRNGPVPLGPLHSPLLESTILPPTSDDDEAEEGTAIKDELAKDVVLEHVPIRSSSIRTSQSVAVIQQASVRLVRIKSGRSKIRDKDYVISSKKTSGGSLVHHHLPSPPPPPPHLLPNSVSALSLKQT